MDGISYAEMERVKEEYLPDLTGKRLLDFGSFDVNGTYRDIFPEVVYEGVDLVSGPGVDKQMVSEFDSGYPDEFFDVIISGQMLEHCRNPFKIMEEMFRVIKNQGFVVITAPFAWPEHKFPVDCFRFLPAGFDCILEQAGFKIIKTYLGGNYCWGIGRKEN